MTHVYSLTMPERTFRPLSAAVLLLAGLIVSLSFPSDGLALPSPAPQAKAFESSSPPFYASYENNTVLSITLAPRLLTLDMNEANSIASETGSFKPARYSFPNAAVPTSVFHDLKRIYSYDRRRDVPIVSSGGDWIVSEYFEAGRHTPQCRFHLLGKRVERQEQLDSRGNTVRIIAIGWTPDVTNADEVQITKPEAHGHPVWMRVFSISRTGNKSLIAVAWTREALSPKGLSDMEPREEDLVFGSPDGVEKWKTKAAFVRRFAIDLDASALRGVGSRHADN